VPGGVSSAATPPRGMSVFTVEPPLNLNSADYPTAQDKVTQANRRSSCSLMPMRSGPCCSLRRDRAASLRRQRAPARQGLPDRSRMS
jgi:hypothetical protein